MVEAIETSFSLIIKYKAGLDEEGKDVFKRLIFSDLNPDASDEDLYAVGNKIGKILKTEIYTISKEINHELINI